MEGIRGEMVSMGKENSEKRIEKERGRKTGYLVKQIIL